MPTDSAIVPSSPTPTGSPCYARQHIRTTQPVIGLPTFLELWDVAYDPAQDCARRDADAKFPGQLGQVPVTKLKAQVPPHTGNDNIVSKPAAAKERMTQ